MNRNINFAAVTGRKADLDRPSRAIKPSTREHHRSKRRRVLSESEEPTPSSQTQDNDQAGADGKTAVPMGLNPHQSALPGPITEVTIASAELGYSQEPTSTLNPLPGVIRSDRSPVIIIDDLDNDEKPRRKNAETHVSSGMTTGPDSSTQGKHARIKDEPLSPDIISRVKLRVKADGHGVSARGPILVGLDVYKTSERLFKSLMSERGLKPEMQQRVSQLTATISGKEMCCRRDRLDDWVEICGEIRELWEKSPTLFDRRFEVDVMLHVDEKEPAQ